MLTVLFSDLSIGQMLAVFSYLWFMIGPVEQLLNLQYAYYAAGGALARINELLARADEPQYPAASTRSTGARPWASRCRAELWLRRRTGAGPDEPVHRPR
jgi:ATP-binding cassette subfamily C protein